MNEDDGSLLVLNLMGGHAAERDDQLWRQNASTGGCFLWEQEAFQPASREIHCHMSLMSGKQVRNRSCVSLTSRNSTLKEACCFVILRRLHSISVSVVTGG